MEDFIRPKKRKPFVSQTNLEQTEDTMHTQIQSNDKEPAFVPPEEISDSEPTVDNDILSAAQEGMPEQQVVTEKTKRKGFSIKNFKPHMPHGKKQWIITILAVLLLVGGGFSLYWFVIKKPAVVQTTEVVAKIEEPPKPTTEASKLSGLQVPIGLNTEQVTSVMIENSSEARPQAGLKDAGVIYEAIAEGGITRFNALYQDTAPDYVGPIRSARPYYLDWLWPFDASVAHVGGSPKALEDIKSLGIKDLDQFANASSFDRITSRYAPHNVYSSIARLNELEKKKGFTTADFTGFKRKVEEKVTAVPTAKTIDLSISSFLYNAHYDYDIPTNTYLRSQGGAAHKDDKSGTQLAPKVVVAIVMNRGIASDGQHTEYTTTGTGRMYVFQDGTVQEGTWVKSGRQAQWEFTDTAGKPLLLNPGQTWITIVDKSESVKYVP